MFVILMPNGRDIFLKTVKMHKTKPSTLASGVVKTQAKIVEILARSGIIFVKYATKAERMAPSGGNEGKPI